MLTEMDGITVVDADLDDPRHARAVVDLLGLATFAARPLVNIHDLAVLPEACGRGVGRRLLEHVEAQARARGCGRLTLEVGDRNETALRLYRAFGFGDGAGGATRFLQKRL
jgi:ribosomal protein S18 acetylase RimI-like enzyme